MWSRIKAILLQELYITKHSLEMVLDMYFYSALSLVVFSFIAVFLGGSGNPLAAKYMIVGALLWEVIRIAQYSLSMGSLWNIWSRNLSNMFITPLSMAEYVCAGILSATVKTLLNFLMLLAIVWGIFRFNAPAELGWGNLALFFLNLSLFAWSSGLVIVGLIFRYGTRIQALAWGAVFLLQPLTAAFFPVGVLPEPLQLFAYAFPPTYVFEAARGVLAGLPPEGMFLTIAFLENIAYFCGALWFLDFMFRRSKQVGQFARNEQ